MLWLEDSRKVLTVAVVALVVGATVITVGVATLHSFVG